LGTYHGFFDPVQTLPPGAIIYLLDLTDLVVFFFLALALLERDLDVLLQIVTGSGCSVENTCFDLSIPAVKLSYSLVK